MIIELLFVTVFAILHHMKPTLVLMCGLPGSGKTTLSHKLAIDMPAVRLCPDEWLRALEIDLFDEKARELLEKQLWQHAKEILSLGLNVILESGFWSRTDRDEKRLWARSNNIAVELHYLEVPLDILLERVQSRHITNKDHEVPITKRHLELWSKFFQAPDETELKLFDQK